MAQVASSLARLGLRADGAWIRCCDSGYWGAFRPTAWIVGRAERHIRKAHKGAVAQAVAAVVAEAGADADAPPLAKAILAAVGADEITLALRRLGGGVARQGFDFGPFCLKVARRGTRQHNLNERAFWDSAPAHIREWLCPVVACAEDGSWLLVRKAERVGNLTWDERSAVVDALDAYVWDLHSGNMGMVDGHPVATDYGFSPKRDPGEPSSPPTPTPSPTRTRCPACLAERSCSTCWHCGQTGRTPHGACPSGDATNACRCPSCHGVEPSTPTPTPTPSPLSCDCEFCKPPAPERVSCSCAGMLCAAGDCRTPGRKPRGAARRAQMRALRMCEHMHHAGTCVRCVPNAPSLPF